MLFWITIKLALRSLLSNKLRSILTMLGMIIGVAAVIAMLALGNGARSQILTDVSNMGRNLITVWPHTPRIKAVLNGSPVPLDVGDSMALMKIPGVIRISPVFNGQQDVQNGNNLTACDVNGTAPTWTAIHNFQIDHGRMFNDFDVMHYADVCVIGAETSARMFADVDPVGHMLMVGPMQFMVIGVLAPKGRTDWGDVDNEVIIPYTTAALNLYADLTLDHIDIQTDDAADLLAVQIQVEKILRQRHHLLMNDVDDFDIENQLQLIQVVSRVTGIFAVFLGSIAGISLLVGGIGIMNIMLVTVTERTREIGIRKAIGARQRDILRQFLIESVLVSVLGGLGGVILGVCTSQFVHLGDFHGIVDPWMVILSISIAAGIGLFFGYYPARRAAKLNPIEALRYE
jgi:putative ABC transport system permease protein